MFTCTREAVINASPEKIFDTLADVERHAELAGSGEVLTVRKLTDGPVGVGTHFEADEDIREPRLMKTKFVAQSEVTRFEPPNLIQWRSSPPMRPRANILWTYSLHPQGVGTRVVQQCQGKGGNFLVDILMFNPVYSLTRGRVIARGMERTLEKLRQMVEA